MQRRELRNYFKDNEAMYKLTARNANVFGSTFALLADAPSQAHLQGTQSQHTKANLAKEPALCQRFQDTLCHGGHRLKI